ncbi:Hsp70 family protein [Modestobacter sp. VKM Ac-2983]|uniref:Hsp70 family protein n=1 Tax=Modestobacter sp. VKM Ac-2983 TaxID=3004137 RepID=UPI0022AB5FF1|nr:Hsp70 family protein [Modestobacter sp. VKM Ac-2983]MCZ2806979.1 Hsp70 family protein [Modestobacter sp. VKM Ac-2983]
MVPVGQTLGIDIGDETVVAAISTPDGEDRWVRLVRPAGTVAVPGLVGPVDEPPAHLPVGSALRRVGASAPMYVDGRLVSPAAAVAALALQVVEHATRAEGSAPARTVLTVPPSWGEHRRDLLTAALGAAGLHDCSLESSSVAVLRHHLGTDGVPTGVPVVVVDVGASTADIAVLRTATDHRIETVAVPPPPVAWGGRDLDDAVVQLVLDCLATEDAAGQQGPDPTAAELRAACVLAKESLSTDPVACVELPGPGGPVSFRLVREDLDEVVAEQVQVLVDAVRRAVADADLDVADVGAVLLAGGTAAVPLLSETLSGDLGRPVVVGSDPSSSAALGAAELARDLAAADQETRGGVGDPPGAPTTAVAEPLARPTRQRAVRAATGPSSRGRRPVADRPPVRSGARQPALDGRRHVARVGVVLASFAAIVLAVAATVSAGWTAGGRTDAAARTPDAGQTAVQQRTDGPQVDPRPPGRSQTAGTRLSPAGAGGRAGQPGDRDPGSPDRTSPGDRSPRATDAQSSPAAGTATGGASTTGPQDGLVPVTGPAATPDSPSTAANTPDQPDAAPSAVPPTSSPPSSTPPSSTPPSPSDPAPTTTSGTPPPSPTDPPPTTPSEPPLPSPTDPPPTTPSEPPPPSPTDPPPTTPPATDGAPADQAPPPADEPAGAADAAPGQG